MGPTMCHLMGTEWITLLQMCLVFVFFILVPITTNRNNENWIHFLGAELSKPLRGYSGYPAEAEMQRGGGRGPNSASLVTPTCHIPPLLFVLSILSDALTF